MDRYEMTNVDPESDSFDSEKTGLLTSDRSKEDESYDKAEKYERLIVACGFGKQQIILLIICGWALASDSTEVQVSCDDVCGVSLFFLFFFSFWSLY